MKNILNGKWFISFKRVEMGPDVETRVDFTGRVIEEVADGWFYVEIFGTGWNVVERKVMSIGELSAARFYPSEIEFRDARSEPIKRRGHEG